MYVIELILNLKLEGGVEILHVWW